MVGISLILCSVYQERGGGEMELMLSDAIRRFFGHPGSLHWG